MVIDVGRAVNAGRAEGPQLRMGLVKLAPGGWLELDHPEVDDQLAEKERLLARSPERFVVHQPAADEPAAELLAAIETELGAAGIVRPETRPGLHPLDRAGRLVHEDLCVHVPVDGRLTLVGGSVCFPTHWSLPGFIGRPLRGLHGDVPHYDTDLADKVDTFLARLSEGPGVMRRNWSLVGSGTLSLPQRSRGWPDLDGDELIRSVWLRSERQTLRRLSDTGAVVFTIGVDVEPLAHLADRPDDAVLFADALHRLSPELARYKGIEQIRPALVEWLRAGGPEPRVGFSGMDDDPLTAGTMYPPGSRQLQDQFDSRRLADRMVEIIMGDELDERQMKFISEQSFFHLATVDPDGFPDVSYKGGAPGFVRCPDSTTIQYPNYDGNGMYRSLGNIVDTGRVALLFSRFGPRATRMRVHGTATVRTDADLVASFPSSDAVVEITVARVFPNCPRYLHDLEAGTLSPSVPQPGHEPPEPDWKESDQFRDVLPGR